MAILFYYRAYSSRIFPSLKLKQYKCYSMAPALPIRYTLYSLNPSSTVSDIYIHIYNPVSAAVQPIPISHKYGLYKIKKLTKRYYQMI